MAEHFFGGGSEDHVRQIAAPLGTDNNQAGRDIVGNLDQSFKGNADGDPYAVSRFRPVDLRDHFASYKTDKRGVIQEVTVAVESQVRQMLADLADRAREEGVEPEAFAMGPADESG